MSLNVPILAGIITMVFAIVGFSAIGFRGLALWVPSCVVGLSAMFVCIFSPLPSYMGFHMHGSKRHRMQDWGLRNKEDNK